MGVAAVLFFAAGALDGVYPGGPGWIDRDALAYLSYVFGLVNIIIAVAIMRGSERGLMLRIVFGAIFFVERVVSALAFGHKTQTSIAVHLVTAAIELAILLSALRVLRLGRSADSVDLDAIFALGPNEWRPAPQGPLVVSASRAGGDRSRERLRWALGGVSLLLAAALVVDALLSGFVPGGRAWDLSARGAGWLSYVYAIVVLAIAVRAVRAGSTLSLRLLVAIGLLIFVERPFGLILLGGIGVQDVALHVVAAFCALLTALAAIVALRWTDSGGLGAEA